MSTLTLYLVLVLQTLYLPMIMQEYEQPCVITGTPLEKAIGYLENCEFNEEVGLVRESPKWSENDDCDVFPRYWLATDNQLAMYALDAAGADEFASTLAQTLLAHPEYTSHGIIKVLNGEDIEIPPKGHKQREVVSIGGVKICHEERSGAIMTDWKTYADLLLYGSLDAHYHPGGGPSAVELYGKAMLMFDGKGFKDTYYLEHNQHPTYKLALSIYTANVIGQPEPVGAWEILLAQQAISGGFVTLYDQNGDPMGSTSTEPTAHAIFALSTRDQLVQSDYR